MVCGRSGLFVRRGHLPDHDGGDPHGSRLAPYDMLLLTSLSAVQTTLTRCEGLHEAQQTQIQDLTFAQERMKNDIKATMEELLKTQVLRKDDVVPQSPDAAWLTELDVLKKQGLELLTQVCKIRGIATEVAEIHKTVSLLASDSAKTGESYEMLVEVHAKINTVLTTKSFEETGTKQHIELHQKIDAVANKLGAMASVLKNQDEASTKLVDKVDALVTAKSLAEATTSLRTKLTQEVKDGAGWNSSQLRDLLTLVRGLGPVMPELKRLGDALEAMTPKIVRLEDGVFAGRRQSDCAQAALQTTSDGVQNIEHRLLRMESLISGVVDTQSDLETQMMKHTEQIVDIVSQDMPLLQEIERRLPKLPIRKPPREPSQEQQAQSQSASSSLHSQQAPAPPTGVPTTLGPQMPQPQVIPVEVQTPGTGIQLRLAEHVGSMTQQQPRLYVSQGNQPQNFLITPVPAQSSNEVLLGNLLAGQR